MQMEEGLDTGPVLLKESIVIDKNINASQLHDQLATLGGKMIVSHSPGWTPLRLYRKTKPEQIMPPRF